MELVQLGESVCRKQQLSAALMVVISILFLNGCSFQHNSHLSPQKTPSSTSGKSRDWKFPIAISNGKFLKVGGWLSDNQILYITNNKQTSSLYRYNLTSGKSTLLFKSEYPIGDIQVSPEGKFIFIQASSSPYQAKITVIDSKGNEKYTQLIPSHELAFDWNPYDEAEVLITIFQEDWSFKVSLLNIDQKMLKPLSLPQPFLKWMNQREIAYINWDASGRELFAPLIIHSLTNGKDQTVFPKVYQFSAFKNLLMTITVNSNEISKAKYSFFNSKLKLIASFDMPQLTKYSDWLVPFYDYNKKRKQFITFKPLKSTSADTYKQGFQLTLYNLANGNGSVLLKGLDNEPISFSPSGDACLYGNRFEKIIDLKTKKITKLVKD